MNIIREWKVVMTNRISRGPVIDQLRDKLKKLRYKEVMMLADNKMSDTEKARYQEMIRKERSKVASQMQRAMLIEELKKNNKTPEELHIKI